MGTVSCKYQSIPESLINHPLKSWQVFTAHNAFLKDIQNLAIASADNIKKSIQIGARYILIDVYEVNGKFVVAHGNGTSITTTPANLNDCLDAIAKNAFINTTDPLLLNVEVNVPSDRRDALSDQIKTFFGSKLLLPTDLSQSVWTTPISSLLNKIVIISSSKLNIDANTGWPDNSYTASSNTIDEIWPVNTENKWVGMYQSDSFSSGLGFNLNPTKYLNAGIQSIAMNVQVNDNNMKTYKTWFNCYGFVLQPARR